MDRLKELSNSIIFLQGVKDELRDSRQEIIDLKVILLRLIRKNGKDIDIGTISDVDVEFLHSVEVRISADSKVLFEDKNMKI